MGNTVSLQNALLIKLQEQRQPEETVVRPHTRRRSKQRSRHHEVEVFSGEVETMGNSNSFIAAHYGGDATKYRTGHHRHYDGLFIHTFNNV